MVAGGGRSRLWPLRHLHMTSMDGGNAEELSGTISAHVQWN